MSLSPQRAQKLLTDYRDGLLHDTLPFWINHSVDHEHGGFIMALDRDGSILDTDKSMWQQGRFTWLLGELYNNVEQRPQWLKLAKHGIDFITKHGTDPTDNRMWFHVTQTGEPIRKRRYAFTESFAAIALGEYAQAAQSDEHATRARQTLQQYIDHNRNPVGVQPKFTNTRPTKGIGFPMIGIATVQQLRDSIQLENANAIIDEFIDEIRTDFIKHDHQVVMETVSPTGQIIDHFTERTLNPGHAIEGAWFIMHEGMIRNDPSLIQTGTQMLDYMWARGWDDEHGGMLYFTDLHRGPVQEYWHDMKFWWPHNETIIATLLAYHLTGEQKYLDMHTRVHDWSYKHFPDPEHGEWFGYLHRDGTPSVNLKGNFWRGPFHLPRMQLYCWKLLEQMTA